MNLGPLLSKKNAMEQYSRYWVKVRGLGGDCFGAWAKCVASLARLAFEKLVSILGGYEVGTLLMED